MTLNHALRLLAMLTDTVTQQAAQIDALTAQIDALTPEPQGLHVHEPGHLTLHGVELTTEPQEEQT